MASSGSSIDDEAFSDRVKKTFGSLFTSLQPSSSSSSSSSSPLSNSPWSLTGAEVEKKEWRRDKDTSARDSTPSSSSFQEFLSHARKNSRAKTRKELEDDLDDLDDEDEYKEEENGDGGGGGDMNDWDLRCSIGLDPTLDNEEEEDTYDKVATGRENAGDRLYMKDITDNNDSHLGSQDDLLSAIGVRKRDRRANHWAARIRLKEDDAEQYKPPQTTTRRDDKEPAYSAEQGDKLKPILKRKERESTGKPSKRVRFDPRCISNEDGAGHVSGTPTDDKILVCEENVSRVPDYVQNPSKYTRYSLDSTDNTSDKSNSVILDLLEMVKRSKNGGSGSEEVDDVSVLPKSVTFVPKKRTDTPSESTQNGESNKKHSSAQPALPLGIAAGEGQETEVAPMEVDVPETSEASGSGTAFRKAGRQYRSKSVIDDPA